MGIVKSLIGSAIGVAVALAVYYGIKQTTGETFVWFPLVVGLVVGLAARVIAGSSVPSGSRVVVGAMAAILTGAAIYAPELIDGMTKTGEFGPIESKNRLVNSSIAKNDSDDEDTENSDSDTPDSGDSESTETKDADSGDKPQDASTDNKDETQQTDDSEQGNETTSEDGNSEDSGDKSTEIVKSDESTEVPPQGIEDRSRMNDRSRGADPGSSSTPPANMEQFAEFINKKKHESWLQTVLPILFTGVGMVMAYVLAQSGAQAPPKA